MHNSFWKTKRFWVFLTLTTMLFSLSRSPLLIFTGGFLLTAFTYPSALVPLKSYKFWVAIGILIILAPVFSGQPDSRFLFVPYNEALFLKTVLMSLRGVLVFLIFQILTMELSSEAIARFMKRMGVDGFDILYRTAQASIPEARSILRARYSVLRDKWNENRTISTLTQFAAEVLADFIRFSEGVRMLQNEESERIEPSVLIDKVEYSTQPCLIIVTGDEGCGKTSWIRQLVRELQERREPVDGVLTERVRDHDGTWAQNLIRVLTGEKRRLNSVTSFDTSVRTGKYYFQSGALSWGNEQLLQVPEQLDWLIIDEVGPLELQKEGLYPSLEVALPAFHGHLVISVRRKLLPDMDVFIRTSFPNLLERRWIIISAWIPETSQPVVLAHSKLKMGGEVLER